MRIIGIDPGYGRCGIAVLEKTNGKEILLFSQCVETSTALSFPERVGEVLAACTKAINDHSPVQMAIEKLFFAKNQKTAMQVAEVRGALMALATQHGLPVSEYTPMQVKSAAAGYGGADKKQVIKMLHALVKIDKEIEHDDEYDAIAIAVTHLAHMRL